MSSRRSHGKESKNKSFKLLLVCIIVFFIGYYLLNHLATIEKPPLGAVFHIVFGCMLMAVSTLFITLTIKKLFFTKKKRSKTRNVFLEDQQRKTDLN